MFETVDAAGAKMPPMFLPHETKRWWSVNLIYHRQWFQVIYRFETEEGPGDSNITFCCSSKQVAEMQLIENCKILEVYLVSPGHVNTTNNWKMDKVKEVWKASLKNDKYETLGRIYILENGDEYMSPYELVKKDDFIKDQLIFRIN